MPPALRSVADGELAEIMASHADRFRDTGVSVWRATLHSLTGLKHQADLPAQLEGTPPR